MTFWAVFLLVYGAGVLSGLGLVAAISSLRRARRHPGRQAERLAIGGKR